MPKYTVNVPDSADFRRMTAAQWLAEYRVLEKGDRSRAFNLPAPVRVTVVGEDERTRTTTVCRTATELFALLNAPGLLGSVSWPGGKLGPVGLYQLNTALLTPAIRKGGHNIVRHWLSTRKGATVPLGCDFAALLSFLEIRPLFTRKTPAPVESTSAPALASPLSNNRPLDIMSHVGGDITSGAKKAPRARKK